MKMILSIFAILIASVYHSSLHAEPCEPLLSRVGVLRTGTNFTLDDWRKAYKTAQEENRHATAAFAYIHMMLMLSDDLKLGPEEVRALKLYRSMLEKVEILEMYPDASALKKNALTWGQKSWSYASTLFHIDDFLRDEDILGQHRPILKRVGQVGKETLQDFAWGMSPFVGRLFLSGHRLEHLKNTKLETVVKNARDKIRHIKSDAFFKEMTARFFSSSDLISKRYAAAINGDFGRVFLYTMMAYLMGYHPVEEIHAHFNEVYDFDDYDDDLEQLADISPEGKNVGFIVDRQVLGIATLLRNDMDALHNRVTYRIRPRAKSLDGTAVSSIAELNQALNKYKDKDMIYIFAHGTPGDLAIGQQLLSKNLDQIDTSPMKHGTTLVFITCSFGDNRSSTLATEKELWIQLLNKKVKSGGRAVAATKILKVKMYLDQQPFVSRAMDVVYPSLERGVMGPLTHPALIDFLQSGVSRSQYGSKAGFLLYDQDTGKITFFQHE